MTAYHNALTPEEERVIERKSTEPPFSGEYDALFADGLYACRRCGALLYRSENKFDAHCGWPSFDDAIPGAIERCPDADGVRIEITCKNCGAHLGHVFTGERLTPKDTRHCVNSLSMKFIPADFASGEKHIAVFAGGCFWCVEAAFKEVKGVESAVSGYAGGSVAEPTYEQVSSGSTGHAEAVKLMFDPNMVTYESLLDIFFAVHNPTELNRQGNDVGEQYRSVIFYATVAQKTAAEALVKKLETERVYEKPIVTEIAPLLRFWPAEEYHQNYFAKHPNAGYCRAVVGPKIRKFRELFKTMLR